MEIIRDVGYREELARLTPNLRRYARALVRNHQIEIADDLVQATLARALSGDHTRRGSRLLNWLLSVLTSTHREQVRNVSAEQRFGGGGGDAPFVGALSWKERQQDPALLSSVPLEYREALLLVVLENLSYVQVGECLGLSVNTVATRVARARDYLARAQSGWSGKGAEQARPERAAVPYLRVVK